METMKKTKREAGRASERCSLRNEREMTGINGQIRRYKDLHERSKIVINGDGDGKVREIRRKGCVD